MASHGQRHDSPPACSTRRGPINFLPSAPTPESPDSESPEPLLPLPGPLPTSPQTQSLQPLTSSTRAPDGGRISKLILRTSSFRNVWFREPPCPVGLAQGQETQNRPSHPPPMPPQALPFLGNHQGSQETRGSTCMGFPHAGPRRAGEASLGALL